MTSFWKIDRFRANRAHVAARKQATRRSAFEPRKAALALADSTAKDTKRVAFVSREAIQGTRRVYNIEVEGAHTFFVGDDGVLAHNECGLSIFWDEYRSSLGAFFRGVGHKVTEDVKYTIDVIGVSADGLVTFAGALTGNNWSLNYQEISDTGRYYSSLNPAFDNQEFLRTVADNSVQASKDLFSMGLYEIYSGLKDYYQTGDADALAERMGAMATGNLLTAAGIRMTPLNVRGPYWIKRELHSIMDIADPVSRRETLLNSRYYKQAQRYENNHRNRPYPPHNGAIHWSERRTKLPSGTVIDRYGQIVKWEYASPQNTPFEYRSLPLGKKTGEYHVFEVVKTIPAKDSFIAPWYGQPGGGIQYRLKRVEYFVKNGYLREVTNPEQ